MLGPPLSQPFFPAEHLPLPSLQHLLNLRVCVTKLPYHRVSLVQPEQLQKRIYGVDTVLATPATTGATNFSSNLNLILLPVIRLKDELGRP